MNMARSQPKSRHGMQRSQQWVGCEEDSASRNMELAMGAFGGEAKPDGCSKEPAREWVQQGVGPSCGVEPAMGTLGGDASDSVLAKEPEGHGSFLIK